MSGRDAAGGGLITWAQRLTAKKWLFRSLQAAGPVTGRISPKMGRISNGRRVFFR
jgi:hypothetical protein